jgi:hypothetical protein
MTDGMPLRAGSGHRTLDARDTSRWTRNRRRRVLRRHPYPGASESRWKFPSNPRSQDALRHRPQRRAPARPGQQTFPKILKHNLNARRFHRRSLLIGTMAMRTIVPRTAPAVACPDENLRQGSQMASQLELSARAALCRQLAEREPTNRVLWMAEAENWLRLSNGKPRGEPEQDPVIASWRVCGCVPQDCLPISA